MTIAIIDKYPILRKGMILFLEQHFRICHLLEAGSIKDFHDTFPYQNPDVIIMAMGQDPLPSNLESIAMAEKWYGLNHVIAYGENIDFLTILNYFRLGVHSYLSKQSDLNELKHCIQQVLEGKNYIDKAMVAIDWISIANKTDLQKDVHLTKRQYEIAKYLSEGKKTSWIARELERKSSTISTIKATIFKKLRIDNVIQLKELIQ